MDRIHLPSTAQVPLRHTANQRLKHSWNAWLGGSIVLAALFHTAVLVLWPHVEVPIPTRATGDPAQALALAAVSGISRAAAPLEEIAAPKLPTVEDLELSLPDNFSVPLPVLSDAAVDEPVAPPLLSMEDEWLDYRSFAPFMVAPVVRNTHEVRRFLERHYQPILEFSGATGIVQVHFWIDEAGGVARAEVAESSGSRSLDRLAMRLSRVLRFSPAMRLGQPVRVLVRLPITFRES